MRIAFPATKDSKFISRLEEKAISWIGVAEGDASRRQIKNNPRIEQKHFQFSTGKTFIKGKTSSPGKTEQINKPSGPGGSKRVLKTNGGSTHKKSEQKVFWESPKKLALDEVVNHPKDSSIPTWEVRRIERFQQLI